jgi:hypothetical protein
MTSKAKGVRTRYAWNDEVGNYCRAKLRRVKGADVFIEPLEQLRVSLDSMDEQSFKETVQMIAYQRTGEMLRSDNIDDFIDTARQMGIYDMTKAGELIKMPVGD